MRVGGIAREREGMVECSLIDNHDYTCVRFQGEDDDEEYITALANGLDDIDKVRTLLRPHSFTRSSLWSLTTRTLLHLPFWPSNRQSLEERENELTAPLTLRLCGSLSVLNDDSSVHTASDVLFPLNSPLRCLCDVTSTRVSEG